jgi:hypothetical protein
MADIATAAPRSNEETPTMQRHEPAIPTTTAGAEAGPAAAAG